MKDRLAELQATAAQIAEEEAEAVGAALGVEVPGGIANEIRIDIEEEGPVQEGEKTEEETFMADFFEQVKEIRTMIDAISERVGELKSRQFAILSAPQIDEAIKEELDQIMLEIKQDANIIRTKLKSIEKSLSEGEAVNVGSASFRIRKTQYNTMYRRLCDVLSDYNEAQVQFRERCKATIKRQLEYTGKSPTDDEVEEMIESGNAQAFTQGIQMNMQQAQQMLRDVTARHEDIKKLENSIKELYDMFMDMAMLVEQQGEMIDRIDANVAQTADFIEEAIKDTEEALQMKRATRKKKCICCTALIIGILVAIIIVVVVVVVQVCGNGGCSGGGGGGGGGNTDPPKPQSSTQQTWLRAFNISSWTQL